MKGPLKFSSLTGFEGSSLWFLSLLILTAYLAIVSPTLFWGDSGFLMGAAFSLGIPHPTGHPLFAVLGKTFSMMPLGSLAFRMNLMSLLFCLLSAVAAFFVSKYMLGVINGKRADHVPLAISVALVSCVWVAISQVMLLQAGSVETYSLELFMMLVISALFLKGLAGDDENAQGKERFFYAGFFLIGIAFGNHSLLTFCLFLPYAVLFIWKRRGDILISAILASLFIMLGLSLYIYLPLRAAADPLINGGDPDSLRSFYWVITGGRYKSGIFSIKGAIGNLSIDNLVFATRSTVETIYGHLGPVWTSLSVIGFALLWRKKNLFFFFSAFFILNIAVTYPWMFHAKSKLSQVGDIGYYLAPVSIGLILGGVGLWWVLTLLNGSGRAIFRKTVPLAICAFLIAALLNLLFLRHEVDRSGDYSAFTVGRSMLSSVDYGGLYFALTDTGIFSPLYVNACEDLRPDVTVLISEMFFDRDMMNILKRSYPELTSSVSQSSLNRASFAKYIEELSKGHSVYLESIEHFAFDPAQTVPKGMVFEVGGRDIERHFSLSSDLVRIFKTFEPSKKYLSRTVQYFNNAARYFLLMKDHENALKEFELVTELDGMNEAAALNMQMLLNELKHYEKAVKKGACLIERFDNPLIYYNYGLSLLYSGRKKEASDIAKTMARRFEHNTLYKEMLSNLRGGSK